MDILKKITRVVYNYRWMVYNIYYYITYMIYKNNRIFYNKKSVWYVNNNDLIYNYILLNYYFINILEVSVS